MGKGDFTIPTKESLRKRAGEKCSKCNVTTSKPKIGQPGFTSLGEAAHIRGKNKGPNNRYDESMTDLERADESNGIWLCRMCHKEIDANEKNYTLDFLNNLKAEHEERVESGFFNYQFPNFHEQKKLDHDKRVFLEGKAIISEEALINYYESIKENGFFSFADLEYISLQALFKYRKSPQGKYINNELNDKFENFRAHSIFLIGYILDKVQSTPSYGIGALHPGSSTIGLNRPGEQFSLFDFYNPNHRFVYKSYMREINKRVDRLLEAYYIYRGKVKELIYE